MLLRHAALLFALLAAPASFDSGLAALAWDKQDKRPPEPTHANVPYGPHERKVLDVWLAKSDAPTPLLVHIHGGGWIRGDKKSPSAETLKFMLDHGVSVASINY